MEDHENGVGYNMRCSCYFDVSSLSRL